MHELPCLGLYNKTTKKIDPNFATEVLILYLPIKDEYVEYLFKRYLNVVHFLCSTLWFFLFVFFSKRSVKTTDRNLPYLEMCMSQEQLSLINSIYWSNFQVYVEMERHHSDSEASEKKCKAKESFTPTQGGLLPYEYTRNTVKIVLGITVPFGGHVLHTVTGESKPFGSQNLKRHCPHSAHKHIGNRLCNKQPS